VQNNDYTDYLKKRAPEIFEEGKFIDTSGKTRGKHDGIANFTIGQRKRINVGSSIPLYVINIDPMTNTVILGAENDLYRKGLIVEDLNWVSINPPDNTIPCEVKIRYNSKPTKATIKLINNQVEVVFDEPQKSITPGQASVFYGINDKADYVLGGGTIKEAI
jgi:tRNA-specific 2-thiouridylase